MLVMRCFGCPTGCVAREGRHGVAQQEERSPYLVTEQASVSRAAGLDRTPASCKTKREADASCCATDKPIEVGAVGVDQSASSTTKTMGTIPAHVQPVALGSSSASRPRLSLDLLQMPPEDILSQLCTPALHVQQQAGHGEQCAFHRGASSPLAVSRLSSTIALKTSWSGSEILGALLQRRSSTDGCSPAATGSAVFPKQAGNSAISLAVQPGSQVQASPPLPSALQHNALLSSASNVAGMRRLSVTFEADNEGEQSCSSSETLDEPPRGRLRTQAASLAGSVQAALSRLGSSSSGHKDPAKTATGVAAVRLDSGMALRQASTHGSPKKGTAAALAGPSTAAVTPPATDHAPGMPAAGAGTAASATGGGAALRPPSFGSPQTPSLKAPNVHRLVAALALQDATSARSWASGTSTPTGIAQAPSSPVDHLLLSFSQQQSAPLTRGNSGVLQATTAAVAPTAQQRSTSSSSSTHQQTNGEALIVKGMHLPLFVCNGTIGRVGQAAAAAAAGPPTAEETNERSCVDEDDDIGSTDWISGSDPSVHKVLRHEVKALSAPCHDSLLAVEPDLRRYNSPAGCGKQPQALNSNLKMLLQQAQQGCATSGTTRNLVAPASAYASRSACGSAAFAVGGVSASGMRRIGSASLSGLPHMAHSQSPVLQGLLTPR